MHSISQYLIFKVHVGDYQLSSARDGAVAMRIQRIITHPGYNGRLVSDVEDVALLYLAQPIQYRLRPPIGAVHLPTPNMQFDRGDFTSCFTAGWGMTKGDLPGSNTDILQQAKNRIMSRKECTNFRSIGVNAQFHLCFSLGGPRSCKGDSGGPLVCNVGAKLYQVGVVSFGDFACTGNSPCVYVKTGVYRQWVTSVINQFPGGYSG